MSDQKIQQLIDDGYEFEAMAYIREAWSIFRKEPGSFIGFFLVFMVISGVAGLLPLYIGPLVNYLIIAPVGAAGFYLVAHMIKRGESFTFSDFFKGVEYVKPLALMSLVLYGIYILLFSPSLISLYQTGVIDWYREILQNPFQVSEDLTVPPFSRNNVLILLLNFLPLLYVQVAYMWAPHFIIFYKKGFWDGLETSRQLITRKWFSVFKLILSWIGIFLVIGLGMGLLISLGAVTSMVLSAVLIFFSMVAVILMLPIIYISFYTAFADVTSLMDEDGEQADILDHLVD